MKFCRKLTAFATALCLLFGAAACAEQAHEHKFEGEWTRTGEPTCTEKGEEERLCACGEKQTRSVPALGHVETAHTGKQQTCTESGWGYYTTCSVCGYSSFREFPPLGHKIYKYQGRDSTCVSRGWDAYQTCLRCDYTTRSAPNPAVGHDYVDGRCTRCMIVASEGLEYKLDEENDEYWVKGFGSFKGVDLVIPQTYEGKPVVGILSYAFSRVDTETVRLKTVDIPGSVRTIRWGAFGDQSEIEYISIGEGVREIDEYAFFMCLSLRSIELPDSLTVVRDGAFSSCDSMSSASFGAGLTEIAYRAFNGCKSLEEITYWGTKEQWLGFIGEDVEDDLAKSTVVHCLDGDLITKNIR